MEDAHDGDCGNGATVHYAHTVPRVDTRCTTPNRMSVEAPEKPVVAAKSKAKASESAVPVVEISEAEIDALADRVTEAREHNLALSAEDYDLLLSALLMMANMHERLSHNDLTIHKLRKLMGIVRSSEKLKDLLAEQSATGDDASAAATEDDKSGAADAKKGSGNRGRKNKKASRKNKPKAPPMKPRVTHHPMTGMCKGDTCPGCHLGKVYKHTPGQFLRIVGHAPLSAEQHVSERLRCNGCGEVFAATLPAEVRADGPPDQQYGYSARSVMAIYKYFAGNPFYRQQTVQGLLGGHLSASTIFDQCEQVANALNPIFKAMILLAADAPLMHLDDTTHRILRQGPVIKSRGGKKRVRTGVYTSAVLALVDELRLVLFQTSVGHAGEWVEELLGTRAAEAPAPTLMSDALSANHVTDITFTKALCNSHARRGFAELALQQPLAARIALKHYEHIWINDSHCHEKGFDAQQRQRHHHKHSLPHLVELQQWCTEELDSKRVEENSNLGKAMRYYLRHFAGLCAFCHVPGAPVDNNEIERLIKIIVRHRKSSLFYQTPAGAAIGDVITSILATCHENGVNAFEYLNAVQRNQEAVRRAPQEWLPWNYPRDP